MLFEIHMLKNYPPVNLNRDDSGAPKTCYFGGSMRGRISSQCLKRTWRTSELFRTIVGENNLGIRTRHFPVLVGDKLIEMGVSSEYVDLIIPKLTGFGNKEGKENKNANTTSQIMFFSPEDIEAAANTVKNTLEGCKSIKDVEKLKAKDLQQAVKGAEIRPISLDIALFGRMVTSDAFRDVEASMQVAHAISTNRITVESDYFTAMDDLLDSGKMEDQGAGMIGDVDYNSSCYYIYASLDTDALKENLIGVSDSEEIVKKTIPALLRTMAFTNPSGKQNSFAGHILPSAVLVECKENKIPTSMVNAFVKPVKSTDIVEDSIRKLAEEADMTARSFSLPVSARIWFSVDKYDVCLESATDSYSTFDELVTAVSRMMG